MASKNVAEKSNRHNLHLLRAVGGRADLVGDVNTALLRKSGSLAEVNAGVGGGERFQAAAGGLAVGGGFGGAVEVLNAAAAPT